MDKVIYIAMSGAAQALDIQTIKANNLANASTIGFRADITGNSHFQIEGDGFDDRATVTSGIIGTDFKAGKFISTGRELDAAIGDQGWFVVQMPDGTEAYTRSGSFLIDQNGVLTNAQGLPILGIGGVINLPQITAIDIGEDGTISVLPEGGIYSQSVIIDQLKLVNPPIANLQKGNDGLFRTKDGQAVDPDPNVRVFSGGLESSNVDAVKEMISMIASSRLYEANMNLIKAAEEEDAAAAQIMHT